MVFQWRWDAELSDKTNNFFRNPKSRIKKNSGKPEFSILLRLVAYFLATAILFSLIRALLPLLSRR